MPSTRRSSRPIAVADIAVAASMLVLGQVEVALHGVDGNPLAAHLLWALVAFAALFRRSRPLTFALVALAASALRYRYGLTPTGGAIFAITVPLALYGIGTYGQGAERSAVLAVAALLLNETVSAAIALGGHGPEAHLPALEWLAQFAIHFAAVAGGVALRDRTEVLKAARARVASLPPGEQAADAALLEARDQIARELHSIVSASVRELMGDVERARAQVRTSPLRAREGIHGARLASKRALAEMRRMLALLRAPGVPSHLPPEPGVGSVPRGRALLNRVPAPLRKQGMPLLILAVEVPGVFLSQGHPELYGSAPPAVRLAGAVALAAAFLPRRRLPLLTAGLVAITVAVRVAVLDDFFALNLALYLAAFSAGAYGRSLPISIAAALTVAATVPVTLGLVDFEAPVGLYAFIAITVGAAWATGYGGRRRLAEAAELRELAAEESQRIAAAAERAVAEERLRVARELHDAVGHGLTSIILQCAAAEKLVESRPEQAIAAIDAVEAVGSEVATELTELLAALRGPGGAEAPRLSRLPELVDRARAGGMRIELEVRGDLERVPAGAAAAAYRILQEGLTNARKHGADGRVRVQVAIEREHLQIAVENPVAAGAGRPDDGHGHGLLGIAERVSLYAGRFRTGATERGTWSVEAELPISAPAPTLTMPLS